jgi:hypothetical protein
VWTLTYEAAPSNEAAASQRIERAVVLSGACVQKKKKKTKNEWHLIDVEDATEINDRIRKIETNDDHTFP